MDLTACDSCDLLMTVPVVGTVEVGRCPRCGAVVSDPTFDSVDRTFLVALSGLLFYGPAVFLPLLTLDIIGREESGSIFEGFIALHAEGYLSAAIAVLLTAVVLPVAKHGLLLFLAGCLKLGHCPRQFEFFLRLYHHLREWGMDEVYLIGLLVTLIKVHGMASVTYEIGFFAFVGMVVCTIGLSLTFDAGYFWSRVEAHRKKTP
jgi:paraquat-inducible protein A